MVDQARTSHVPASEAPPSATSVNRVTRRAFVGGAAGLAVTSGLSGCSTATIDLSKESAEAQAWNGYGGVGDYASSHGNVWSVVKNAHSSLRDSETGPQIDQALLATPDETVDLLIVGSGIAGLSAAFAVREQAPGMRAILLDNSPVFGGESKQNEFLVDNVRMFGPQGASGFGLPAWEDHSVVAELYRKLNMPAAFDYRPASGTRTPLEFDRSNFGYKFKSDISPSFGWFFDETQGVSPRWERNIWADNLSNTPFSPSERADLLRWRTTTERPFMGTQDQTARWLDRMTYHNYLTQSLKLGEIVTRYINPIIGVDMAAGTEMSALAARDSGYPGFIGLGGTGNEMRRYADIPRGRREAFPGGNSGIARYFLKTLLPEAIVGSADLHDIIVGRFNREALDQPGAPLRIRQNATVVVVRQAPNGRFVDVVYRIGNTFRSIRAHSVVMATGSWANKHVCRDLSPDHAEAMQRFSYTPVLVANVALRNWRFMDRLGITACRWFSGQFGFACNIRTPMVIGDATQPFSPDKPALMTFYVPFGRPGMPLDEQGPPGRMDMYATSAETYCKRLRDQMTHMFKMAGFDADRDIAQIVLNRWGHAYSNPWPGFYHRLEDKPTSQEVLRLPWGRVAFGHSEIGGKQTFGHAVEEGTRAAHQALAMI